ncbi:glycosyltransferase family 2 protein [Neptunicella marina]|uniref:Glycosyltransferase family 2 protein n=1 Tax=Neptunicella marina TaxID=2125989 RepID=A0A8J6M480_9ALTE|nr:glycosyltransferase family 2 protein [Neptunicella marina]MBC3765891.1 glycosyltransferase family 2 protein [Neptunicella marina]
MKVSVIFSTYNSPDWMEKVLWGFHFQTYQNFEIIIADDGSLEETRERIAQFEQQSGRKIKHVWQEDNGFQKCQILNKAIVTTEGEYLIFTDGDCIPRSDFIQAHVDNAKPGHFLSGGYFKLPMDISHKITKEDIQKGVIFDADWLIANGLKKTHKLMKLNAKGWRKALLNKFTPTTPSWNGHNASCWRELIVAANGFDERMQYGGEDREFGERLVNSGIKPIQIRYSAICVHLDHARGYVKPEMIAQNKAIRAETKVNKVTRTPFGIEKV